MFDLKMYQTADDFDAMELNELSAKAYEKLRLIKDLQEWIHFRACRTGGLTLFTESGDSIGFVGISCGLGLDATHYLVRVLDAAGITVSEELFLKLMTEPIVDSRTARSTETVGPRSR